MAEDFEMICPYCNCEFNAEIGQSKTEIKCPECNNIIELDWNGNPDDNNDEIGCSGNCHRCGGCRN
jgi:hypothetical protein